MQSLNLDKVDGNNPSLSVAVLSEVPEEHIARFHYGEQLARAERQIMCHLSCA